MKNNMEKMSFYDVLDYGDQNSHPPHWSFNFYGFPVTKINDEKYLIVIENLNLYFIEGMEIIIDTHKVTVYLNNQRILELLINQKQ